MKLCNVLPNIAKKPGTLAAYLIGDLVLCSALYSVIEHKGPIEGAWWSIVTGFTVGYGDQYPATTAGRGVGAFLIVTFAVLYACAIGQIAGVANPNPHLFSDDEQRQLLSDVSAMRVELAELRKELRNG